MPRRKQSKDYSQDRSRLENSVKTLAANIRFASVDNPIRSIVLTSSVPDEGKTTVALSLAEAIATGGRSVLFIDGDMRRRSLGSALHVHGQQGIYAVLAGQTRLEDALVTTQTRGLYFLDCEPHIPNPADILASQRFQRFLSDAENRFDYVILDTPPLGAFVDAAVASTHVDATVLVVRERFAKRSEVTSSLEQLKKAGANVIGSVLNFCEDESSDYYYYYYTSDGKKVRRSEHTHDAPPLDQPATPAPASAPATRRSAAAAGSARAGSQRTDEASGGLRPLPSTSPDSTSAMIAAYQSQRIHDDE